MIVPSLLLAGKALSLYVGMRKGGIIILGDAPKR